MLFSPAQLKPDTIALDATKAFDFTWLNRGDSQSHYRLKIYLNTTSAQVYDSTKLTSTVSKHTLPANTLTNPNEYKYQLEVFSGSQSVLSEFYFFKTNTTPVITMTVASTITTTSATFNATYTQAQNIPYFKYKFILYNSADIILDSTDWLYGYDLSYKFDGFNNNTSYKVECITESQYGLIGTSGKKSFSVVFVAPDALNILQTEPNNNDGTVNLSWSTVDETQAEVSGSYSYVTGKFNKGVQLYSDSKITYRKYVPEGFTLNLWCKFDPPFSGDIVTLGNDEFAVGYLFSSARFYIRSNGETVYSIPVGGVFAGFLKLAIVSNRVIIKTVTDTAYIQ